MAATCHRPIADNSPYNSIIKLVFQFPTPPHPSDASVFGGAARFDLSAVEKAASMTDRWARAVGQLTPAARTAELPEDGEVSDSDDDDDLPSLRQILASPKQVIEVVDLTSDDDDDDSEGGDDDGLTETTSRSPTNLLHPPPPSLPASPAPTADDAKTSSTVATPGRKKHLWVNVPSWSPLHRRLEQYSDLPHVGTGSPGSPLGEFQPLPEDSGVSVTERPASPPQIPETPAVAFENIRREEDGHGGDGEKYNIDQTQTIACASIVADGGDLDVDEGGSVVRGENGPVMVDISTFTTANILGKRSSSSGVEYECELGLLWLAADMVEGLQMGRVHILSYEKGLIRDARVDTLRPKKPKLSPTEAR